MLCWFLLYKVNQLDVYIYLLPLGPCSNRSIPPLQVFTEHWAELPVLYSSFPQLSGLHMGVYKCQHYCLCSSHPVLTPLCSHVSSLRLHLSSCLEIGSSVLFFQIPHICIKEVGTFNHMLNISFMHMNIQLSLIQLAKQQTPSLPSSMVVCS